MLEGVVGPNSKAKGKNMSNDTQKWELQKWLEKERPGTWRGLDLVHIDSILEAFGDYVRHSDGTLLDMHLEVFLARWMMLAKQAEARESEETEMWASRRK